MKSLIAHRLLKAFPFVLTAFTVLMWMHGLHVYGTGLEGHGAAVGTHLYSNYGDPGGPGEPNSHFVLNWGDPGGPGEPN